MFKNNFSFSFSRLGMFSKCKQQYAYNYYRYWGGWDKYCDNTTRQNYVLKNLQSAPGYVGSLVHSIIQSYLIDWKRNRVRPTTTAMKHDAKVEIKAAMISCRDRKWLESPKLPNFAEIYYLDTEPTKADYTRLYVDMMKRAHASIDCWFTSDVVKKHVRVKTDNWMTIDDLSTFDFNGVTCYCALDFAYKTSDGKLHIVDWKTGKLPRDNSHNDQLGVYAYYAGVKWGYAPEDIVVYDVYIKEGVAVEVKTQVTQQMLDSAVELIGGGIDKMSLLIQKGSDNELNEGMVDTSPSRFNCGWCNYREMCNDAYNG